MNEFDQIALGHINTYYILAHVSLNFLDINPPSYTKSINPAGTLETHWMRYVPLIKSAKKNIGLSWWITVIMVQVHNYYKLMRYVITVIMVQVHNGKFLQFST